MALKQKHRILALLLSIVMASLFLPCPQWMTNSKKRNQTFQKSILMIGNSFTAGENLPHILEDLVSNEKHPIRIASIAPGGKCLYWHAENAETLEMLRSQAWDYVILQDCSNATLEFRDYFEKGVREMVELVKKSKATPLLFMTWADKGLFEKQEIISEAYKKIGAELGVEVVPVGEAWSIVQKENSTIDLFASDNHHASAKGALLTAYMFANRFIAVEEVTVLTSVTQEPVYLFESIVSQQQTIADEFSSSFLRDVANKLHLIS